MKATLFLVAVVLLHSTDIAGRQSMSLRVTPRFAYAPAEVYVYVTVEPRADNRMLVVKAESEEYFRSSAVELDGEASARVTVFHFRQIPSGTYGIEVELIDSNGQTKDVTRDGITVL